MTFHVNLEKLDGLMARRRRKKPYVYTFELAIFSEYVFCLYFYLLYVCFASIKNNLIEYVYLQTREVHIKYIFNTY